MRTTDVGPFGQPDDRPRSPLRLCGAGTRGVGAGEAPAPQPIPLETLVLQRDDATYISRSWEDRDDAARNCRLCPAGACRISPLGNCLVRVNGFVPTAMAALWPKATPGLGLAAAVAPGLGRDGTLG